MNDSPPVIRDREELLARLTRVVAADRRFLLGIAGPPGAGKSTFASWLEAQLNDRFGTDPLLVAQLPMDGFHLSNETLAQRGLRDRKGAPETFDVAGYAALLHRAGTSTHDVYAPAYSREQHEPVPDAHRIPGSVRLVITEGNYLLVSDPPWPEVAACLDEVWFLSTGREVTRQRLIDRQVAGGRSPADAEAWVDGNDMRNTALVEASAERADVMVDLPPAVR